MPDVTLTTLQGLKQSGEKIAMLTCYDATFAHTASQAGVDVLLVGDSLGMVLQGHDSTLPVSNEEMAYHTACVKRGNKGSLIVTDLAFESSHSVAQTLADAVRLMQAGAHMVKLEGGAWLAEPIARLAQMGVPVCAHLGLTPQAVNLFGGFKVQGRQETQARQLRADAIALEQAGAAMLLLECVPSVLAEEITQAVKIPVIGIGAGAATDGQVLVMHDMLGLSLTGRSPKFVKDFMQGQESIPAAIAAYVRAVKDVSFPRRTRIQRMNTVKTVRELRAAVARARSEGKRIGFVPTMGNLHAGHAALVKKAGERADFVVVSIFVNPLQFGPSEDLDTYPRTLAADQERLLEAGCHLLFTPTVEEMYPDGMDGQTRIHVPGVSEGLCGASRPGHFEGVATVVSKLLNMVQPDLALFGEKDFQQLAVIRKLVRDLNLPVQIFGEPTVRAADGLALSSRNGYLDEQQRAAAPAIYRTLRQLGERIRAGAEDFPALLADARQALEQAGLRPDYLEIREPISLRPGVPGDRQLVILAAAYLGSTRLIDNLSVHLD